MIIMGDFWSTPSRRYIVAILFFAACASFIAVGYTMHDSRAQYTCESCRLLSCPEYSNVTDCENCLISSASAIAGCAGQPCPPVGKAICKSWISKLPPLKPHQKKYAPPAPPLSCYRVKCASQDSLCSEPALLIILGALISLFVVWVILRFFIIPVGCTVCGCRIEPVMLEVVGLLLFVVASIMEFVDNLLQQDECNEDFNWIEGLAPWFEVVGCILYSGVVLYEFWQGDDTSLSSSWHVVPFVVMLVSSVLSVVSSAEDEQDEKARWKCGSQAYLIANIFDGIGIALFVFGGMMEAKWEPKALPQAHSSFMRLAYGLPQAVQVSESDADPSDNKASAAPTSEEGAAVEAWKDVVLARVDYLGCSFLLPSVVIPMFFNGCNGFSEDDVINGYIWIELVGCACFLIYSSFEKNEVEEELKEESFRSSKSSCTPEVPSVPGTPIEFPIKDITEDVECHHEDPKDCAANRQLDIWKDECVTAEYNGDSTAVMTV